MRFLFFLLLSCSRTEDMELAYIVAGECLQCPYEEKVMVANVVLNRMDHGAYPDRIDAVISQPGQFHGYCSGWYVWDRESYLAALEAKKKRQFRNIIYFWRGKKPDYVGEVTHEMKYHRFGK